MNHIPLAERMRPQRIEDLLGQDTLLSREGLLTGMVSGGNLPSMILWGPPGCGKTTLARLLATGTRQPFHPLSAVDAGVKEVRTIIEQSNGLFKPLLFLDEIHRFNKAQQDSLLGAVEQGRITLIGATTENPSYSLNPALLSRCQLVVLQPLSHDDLLKLARRALAEDHILSTKPVLLTEWNALLRHAQGDARRLLNLLEMLWNSATGPDAIIDDALVTSVLPHFLVYHDRDGDQHYQLISALIKSVRGSDPQAATYYLARLVLGGEDPVFIARRLLILAAEDIGLANPQALILAEANMEGVARIGYPEARILLSQTVLYLSLSPKSNSAYLAIDRALDFLHQKDSLPPVPEALRNAVTNLDRQMGFGQGYQYSHDGPYHFIPQEFMPEGLHGKVFYQPASNPREEAYQVWLQAHWPQYPLDTNGDHPPKS
jgi:putative ATPase